MRKFIFFVAVLALVIAYRDWQQRPIVHLPGVLVPLQPAQTQLSNPSPFEIDEYTLTPRAAFDIQARVLGREAYFLGRESRLSPLDLALGWNRMSDQAVVDRIEVRQSGRWYYTRYELPPPLDEQEIIRSSANMHMIPADGSIKRQLRSLRPGEVVRIRGLLVDVDHDSGWKWRTSLTRDDTGQGACELVFVEDLARINPDL